MSISKARKRSIISQLAFVIIIAGILSGGFIFRYVQDTRANGVKLAPASGQATDNTPDPVMEMTYFDQQKVVTLTNEDRAAAGVAPVQLNTYLVYAANDRCTDEATRNYYAHVTPDGIQWYEAIKKYTSYYSAGENLAKGHYTPESVEEAWMASPGHKKNILNPSFNYMGIAVCVAGNEIDIVEEFAQI